MLHSQRQSLQGAVDRHAAAHEDLAESSTLMKRLYNRETVRRVAWISVIVLLLIAIVLALWWKSSRQ